MLICFPGTGFLEDFFWCGEQAAGMIQNLFPMCLTNILTLRSEKFEKNNGYHWKASADLSRML